MQICPWQEGRAQIEILTMYIVCNITIFIIVLYKEGRRWYCRLRLTIIDLLTLMQLAYELRMDILVFKWVSVTYRFSLDRLLRLDIHLHRHNLWCCPPLFPHCSAHPRPRFVPDLETSPESPEPQTHKYVFLLQTILNTQLLYHVSSLPTSKKTYQDKLITLLRKCPMQTN